MSLDAVRRILRVDTVHGLTREEVARRRAQYGANILPGERRVTLVGTILRQLQSPLAVVLLGAGIVTLGLGETVDATVVFLALALNIVVGTLQEGRASRAFEALQASQEQHAIVVRDGARCNIPASEVVPGDLLVLEGGYRVPADVRVVEEKDLTTNEAALTGEWLAVAKDAGKMEGAVPLAERTNMAWMGTLIESGYGTGVVVATGAVTELGRIAGALGAGNEPTPLQVSILSVARFLSYAVGVALVIIMAIGLLRGEPFGELLLIAIAVAVATIPAGLPTALTVVLAIGMEAILKRGGLVRNLLAAETLGSTTVILTDKTGTLTEARMKLAGIYTSEGICEGVLTPGHNDNHALLSMAVMASDAFVEESTTAPAKLIVHGRPIEKALVVGGLEAGIVREQLLSASPQLDHLQFTSTRRYAVSLHEVAEKRRAVLTGEPELLLSLAARVYKRGRAIKVQAAHRRSFAEALAAATGKGMRLIGVGYYDTDDSALTECGFDRSDLARDLVFVGLLAFDDPVRSDVSGSIHAAQEAGARVIMLTGDNPHTARHIASQVGIITPGDELVLTGSELDPLDDQSLYTRLQDARVVARALPEHKLRIARILKRNGEVVAMTGDGVNDAPALRAASIGIAVGAGTEVAREASDLILLGNSFSVIVAAIEEGRLILDNLKKIVAYLLSTSFSEIFLIMGALLGGAPLPLMPVQILWANIVGGDLMSFSFAFERKDPQAMHRNPRSNESRTVLTRELVQLIVLLSVVTGLLTVLLYYGLMAYGMPLGELRTLIFVALTLDSFFFAFSLKSLHVPVWRIDLTSNRYLLASFLVSLALLLGAFFVPPLARLLALEPLSPLAKLVLCAVGVVNLVTIEILKHVLFREKSEK